MLALPFVPLAFVAEHALPPGIPTAEGCSGSFSGGEGWQDLAVQSEAVVEGEDGVTRVPVATDGFVVLGGQFDDLELDVDVSGVDVSVTDADGANVPGALQFLRATSVQANYHGKRVYLGWAAAAPLDVGAQLTLALRAAPAPRETNDVLEDQVELEVVGPPTTLADISLAFGPWVDFEHGIGTAVRCLGDYGSCGTEDLLVRTQIELLFANDTRWQPPVVTGMVAWEARAEVVGAAASIASATPAFVFDERDQPVETGLVVFPEESDEYCAVLAVRDLRTGAELRSEPACAQPEAAEWTSGDNAFRSCAEPPSDELHDAWCEAHENSPDACAPPAGGAAGAPAEPGSAGSPEAGSGGAPTEPEPSRKKGSSSGCQLGGDDAGSLGAWLGLVLAGAWLQRARSRRPNRAAAPPAT